MTRPLRGRPVTRPLRGPGVAAALLVPLLTATACGIKPTGVVESGAAARVTVARAGAAMAYFVTPDGLLAPAPQPEYTQGGPRRSVIGLLRGPGPAEREAGLGSRVPVVEGEAAEAGVSVTVTDRLEVRLPFPVAGLDPLGRRQLVCSALSTVDPRYGVVLRGTDTALDPARCDAGL
ncbi:hypothetical protein ACGFY6_10850 [Streptomyces sp. NPDC048387]|uniref:hypothetical protein n=1 Tax=Streptomyces sp. NPDC048387 TaxID=3365542 RepID=UPI003722B047